LDNTVYKYEPCRIAAENAFFLYARSSVGIKLSESRKAYNSARLRVHDRVRGASRHDRRLYFIEYLRVLGLKSDPQFVTEANNHYWFSYFEKMKLASDVESFIIQARLRNILIALVTDLTSEIQYRKLLSLNIHNLFDVVITSQETELEKDSGQPYKLLLSNIRLKTLKNCLIINQRNGGDMFLPNVFRYLEIYSPFFLFSNLSITFVVCSPITIWRFPLMLLGCGYAGVPSLSIPIEYLIDLSSRIICN